MELPTLEGIFFNDAIICSADFGVMISLFQDREIADFYHNNRERIEHTWKELFEKNTDRLSTFRINYHDIFQNSYYNRFY